MKPHDDLIDGEAGITAAADDDANPMPCAGALLAGTLALMTSWADPCQQARCGVATQRRLMARKIVSNLYFLMHHPQVAPPLRSVMSNAHRRWVLVAASIEEGSGAASVITPEPGQTLH
jgi:hypothetical protein